MAYCLRSLVGTLEQVLHPHEHHKNWIVDQDKIPQIQSLFENATFLLDFLDNSSPLIHDKIASLDLDDQIMDAAEKAEDTLESYITSQILSSPEGQGIKISPPDLREVIQAFEVAKQELVNITVVGHRSDNIILHHVSSSSYPNSKNMVVGVTEDLAQLKSRLTSRISELEIIPIVGMGGTGKTTLARILYNEYSSNKFHFDCCAWVTVSQIYDPRVILKTLIDCMIEKAHHENDDLVGTLYKSLIRRRYLIVLDDIWSYKAWDDLRSAFPKENMRSRIILTTRENIVANYFKSESHDMHLINKDDSWELLRGKVFGEESCPLELKEVGKIIVKNCGGLPLALQVIGGLLSQSQRSKDFWEYVAHDVSSCIAKTDDKFSGIFSWSFAHLPHYLKPCFLYMGAFPEDFAIPATKVIKMWVAEGFLYPNQGKSLEEAAEMHLKALVDRNLIFVRERKSSGKAKSYGIHDLLRDLCLKKSHEKKFLGVRDSKTSNNMKTKSYAIHDLLKDMCLCFRTDHEKEDGTLNHRRFSVHLSGDTADEYGSLKLTSFARSFILTGGNETSNRFVGCLCFKLSLLRVLEVYKSEISEFQEVFLQLVNLRYLAIDTKSSHIPTRISVLKNLQTLIVNVLTSIEILEDLPQLRHLKFRFLEQTSSKRFFSVHENLRSLSDIRLDTLTPLLGKLPKLRKLEINRGHSNDSVDLSYFQELETLNCWHGFLLESSSLIGKTIFPHTLTNLTLKFCGLSQTLLTAIGVLPGLQVLRLDLCTLEKTTWEPSEDEFCQLQYLEIDFLNLENWSATASHFPVLRHLILRHCSDLNEIPGEIGEINTLKIIEVDYCKRSVFESAKRILEEQDQFNNTLQLRLGNELEEKKDEEEELEFLNRKVENHELSLCVYHFSSKTIFPQSLRKLTLKFCDVPQTLLHAIGVLPELEVLKLKYCKFENTDSKSESSTWEPYEGELCKLQSLKLVGPLGLEKWSATEIQFPALRHLVLKDCHDLDDIPHEIGGIKTLEIIEVDRCKPSVADSARTILEEQSQSGNTLLQLRLGRV